MLRLVRIARRCLSRKTRILFGRGGRPRRLASLAAALLVLGPGPARSGQVPLEELPEDFLRAAVPLLRHGEVGLIESVPSGRLKQVTLLALVAAAPEVVREATTTPELWPTFVPNVRRASVDRHPDGSLDYDFSLDLRVVSLAAHFHMAPRADGAVEFWDNDPGSRNCQRWRFFGVPGGTVMVQYSFTDLDHASPYLRRVVEAAPLAEHGLALAGGLAYVRAMKLRAEALARAGTFPPIDGRARSPGFQPLLDRGRVVVVRSLASGRLADISILDQVSAPVERVLEVLGQPDKYPGFVDGVHKVSVRARTAAETDYDLRLDLSVLHLESSFRMRSAPGVVDVVGDGGDQRISHVRWDVTPLGSGRSQLVYRANQDLRAASPVILGSVLRLAPFFEPGIAVAIGLMYVVGVRGRAEGWR